MINVSLESGETALKLLLYLCSGESESIYPQHFDLVIADYLRKNLYSISVVGEEFEPVYVTKFVNLTVRQISPLTQYTEILGLPKYSKEQLEISIRRILAILRDLRDVVELGKGYWAPAPLRFIDLPNSSKALVVGSLPTYNLNTLFSPIIKVAGFMRFVDKLTLLDAKPRYPVLWQQFDNWIGDIPPDLANWTRQIIKSATDQLQQSAANYNDFEVYCPWDKNKLQYYRWLKYEDLIKTDRFQSTDLFLLRSKGLPRTFWLGKISPTALEAEARVPNYIVHRLLYGLDLLNNNGVKATWTGNIITFENWLPPEEQRLLYAVGTECSPEIGKLPLKFSIQPEWKSIVNDKLQCLGLIIKEELYEK